MAVPRRFEIKRRFDADPAFGVAVDTDSGEVAIIHEDDSGHIEILETGGLELVDADIETRIAERHTPAVRLTSAAEIAWHLIKEHHGTVEAGVIKFASGDEHDFTIRGVRHAHRWLHRDDLSQIEAAAYDALIADGYAVVDNITITPIQGTSRFYIEATARRRRDFVASERLTGTGQIETTPSGGDRAVVTVQRLADTTPDPFDFPPQTGNDA